MPKIYDNIEEKLSLGLIETLRLSKRCDFCVGYFNLRGWHQIADAVDSLPGMLVNEKDGEVHRCCRLLIGMQKVPFDLLKESYIDGGESMIDNKEMLAQKIKTLSEFDRQLVLGVPTQKDENYLRKLKMQLQEKKLAVRLYLRNPLHAKLYIAAGDDPRIPLVGFLGSSNLTLAGLLKQGELNIDVMDQDAAAKLSNWFNLRWDDSKSIDITEELIKIIDQSWAADRLIPPFHIYLKIAYHLSREARAGIGEYRLPKQFKHRLLDFQEKAVYIAARYINRRGGVMIGDVVGLGKTIIACAVAKIFYEDLGWRTLIICPKNIEDMWKSYRDKYDLNAKIISQSMVKKRLLELKRYQLVIIDESHNLRNDISERYRAIKAYIEENESKVVLLSATPYNKSYSDLSSQLRLFIADDKDLGIIPEKYIKSIGGQACFSAKHTETFIRSIKAFEKSEFSDDWLQLMSLYLIRRTRSFIKKNYAQPKTGSGRKYLTFSDGTRTYFPDRIIRKAEYSFNPRDKSDQYSKLYSEHIVQIITGLELPRYGLGTYIDSKYPVSPTQKEGVIIANLSRAGKRLIGFCRTNLFKRLESSGYSFLLSLSRHVLRNFVFIYAAENRLRFPIGKNITNSINGFIQDQDMDESFENENISFINDEAKYMNMAEELYKRFESECENEDEESFDWIRSEMFVPKLKESLINDSREIIKVLKTASDWEPSQDRQLNALCDLITNRHKEDKIIIFTQFTDTAYYLYEQLNKRGIKYLGKVTGKSESPASYAYRFSPVSNEKEEIKGTDKELRVLISTDVLSEGQNLQDAHIILNYDLPWAIIRLIQRAGRVDRIGQKSDKIICYSFLPEDGVEKIIRLRDRLKNRIKQNAEVVGSDETFFDGDPINIRDLYNEKSEIFDDDDDSETDISSYAYEIWNDAVKKDHSLATIIPNMPDVVYSTKQNTFEKQQQGVIVYAETKEGNDVLTWLDSDKNLITGSQLEILKAAKCCQDTKPVSKLADHHEIVKIAVDFINKEEIITSGSLGRKSGVKYRVYTRLEKYLKEHKASMFVTEEMKKAVDDIFRYPLKEAAIDTINRQLKSGISDNDLAHLIVLLREDDSLCITENEEIFSIPKIICSMGIKKSLI